MLTQERVRFRWNLRGLGFIALLTICSTHLSAQSETRTRIGAENRFYARANTFGVFAAYSPDSTHILLGFAENRKLLQIGVSYSRRILLNRAVNWQYDGEVLPLILESDPVAQLTADQTSPTVTTFTMPYGPVVDCAPQSAPYTVAIPNGPTYSGTETVSCSGRRWTVGEGMSPVGFQWNFVPRHKLQPFFVGHGGYMYSSQPIPIAQAGSFNFTFDLGVGFELYRSRRHSIRGEFRYHHISNHGTAAQNPGIDNLLYQVTYAFGR